MIWCIKYYNKQVIGILRKEEFFVFGDSFIVVFESILKGKVYQEEEQILWVDDICRYNLGILVKLGSENKIKQD